MNAYPYVYRLVHKTTNEFYFGYRCANTVNASLDLGKNYFTSSKDIKPRFNEFDFEILAEFFNAEDAYFHEQSLIEESWQDPLILNKAFHKVGGLAFKNKEHSLETKEKLRNALKDKKRPSPSDETKMKMSEAAKGRIFSESHKQNLSKSRIGNNNHNTPHSEETKKKLSDHFKGRKRKPFSDLHRKRLSERAKERELKKKNNES